MYLNCPRCGSDNTRKISTLYREVASSSEEGNAAQRKLAKRCSPPEAPTEGVFLARVGVVFSIGLGYTIGSHDSFLWGVGAFLLSLAATGFLIDVSENCPGRKKKEQHRQKIELWEKTWLCMECDNDFIAEGQMTEADFRFIFEPGAQLIGKNLDDIIDKAGNPSSLGDMDWGRSVATWHAGHLHAEVWFQSQVCTQVIIGRST